MRSLSRALLVRLAPAAILYAQAGAPAPIHYKLTQEGSVLRWELPATLHTVRGSVPALRGTIDAEPAGNGEWTIRIRIAVAAEAMATGNNRRDRTMRERVLETGKFPEIVFEATKVTADLSKFKQGESFAAQVLGELTVHGKPLPVQLPVDVHVFADHAILSGSFPIHWKQYGLHDPSFGVVKVRDPMTVFFRLRAVPAE